MSKPLYMQLDYIDRKINQSMMWANGKPTHDTAYDECCADFSCCHPDLFERDMDKRIAQHTSFVEKLLKRRNEGHNDTAKGVETA